MSIRHKVGLGLRNTIAALPGVQNIAAMLKPRTDVFSSAYEQGKWGSQESGSGTGSELAATENIRTFLPELLKRHGVTSMLDAPCGDWNWMRLVDLGAVEYVGADIVPSVIANNEKTYARTGVRFMVADLTRDPLPKVDLVMCRDCWVHLSFADIAALLKNFRTTGAKWLLVTNTPSGAKNLNQLTGHTWRYLDLRLAPFNFPEAVEAAKDHFPDVPFEITLYRMSDLPDLRV